MSSLRLCVLLVSTSGTIAVGQPVIDPSSGNAYERVGVRMTWSAAEAAARERTFGGMQGHLATITSAPEQSFLVSAFTGSALRGCWLGGYQPAGSSEPGGGWRWLTGEPWAFAAWAPNEPNNASGYGGGTHEDGLQYKASNNNTLWNDFWRDSTDASWVMGYIVEWSCPVIHEHPSSKTICSAGVAVFTHTSSGSDPLIYRWEAKPDGTDEWVVLVNGDNPGIGQVQGATADTLRVDRGVSRTSFRCVVSNPCRSVATDPAVLIYCDADVNCDGELDFFDYLDFAAAFDADDVTADFNGDNQVDFFDYLDFAAAFDEGCE